MTSTTDPLVDAVYAFSGRATRAIIDLDALAANVRELKQLLAPDTKLMAIVKAYGYGHGAVMVSRTALDAGAEMLGVATVGEAADLRANSVTAPILLLGPCDPGEVERAISLDVEFMVGSMLLLEVIARAAVAASTCARIHIKIDSGMHRYGASCDDVLPICERAELLETIDLVGLATHFASADDPSAHSNTEQIDAFGQVVEQVRALVGRPVAFHMANSGAAIHGLATNSAIARIGIAMYGLSPGPETQLPLGIDPVLSLTSRLARVHQAPPGSGISYGHTYQCADSERLGLLPIGYADGYRRGLANLGWVTVHGAQCPVRGRVCMDQTVVGNLPSDAEDGDLVGIAGPIGEGPSIDELAALLGTINYEIISALSPRIPRYYVSAGKVTASLIEGQLAFR